MTTSAYNLCLGLFILFFIKCYCNFVNWLSCVAHIRENLLEMVTERGIDFLFFLLALRVLRILLASEYFI